MGFTKIWLSVKGNFADFEQMARIFRGQVRTYTEAIGDNVELRKAFSIVINGDTVTFECNNVNIWLKRYEKA